MRNLALRAEDAARNTASLIENTIQSVANGNELTHTTQEAFKENMEIAQKVGGLVDEISAASNEQAQGIEEINKAVAEMDKVVQQVAANAEESAAASEEMSAQAEEMQAFVAELVAMVGAGSVQRRSGAAGGNHKKDASGTGKEKRKALAAPSKTAKKNSEENFQVEDDDFKGF